MDNYTVAAAELISQRLLTISLSGLNYSIEERLAFVLSSQRVAHCVCLLVNLRVLRLVSARPRDLTALTHWNASVSLLANRLLLLKQSLPLVVAEGVGGLDFDLLLASHHGWLGGLLLPAKVVVFWLGLRYFAKA